MRSRSSRSLAVMVFALVLGVSPWGAAQAQSRASVRPHVDYSYDPVVDVPLTLVLGALGGASLFVDHELPGPSAGDPANVFFIDRGVARRAEDRVAARTSSDVLLLTSVGFGLVASAFSLDHPSELSVPARRRARFRRIGVFVESLVITNAATTVVKLAVRRPRPYTYAPGYDGATARFDDQLSYFSGHTSTVAAIAGTASYLAFAEAPRSARAWSTLGLGVAATSVVAALRVRAGKHFPTDVLTGALVGASIGVLVPHVHRTSRVSLSAEVSSTGGLLLVGGRL